MKNKNCSVPKLKNIEKILMNIGIEIARKGEGALFIISDKIKYRRMIRKKIQPFSVFDCDARKILVSIGTIDGAVMINHNGVVYDCGAEIVVKKVLRGYGTRHAAAYSASFEKKTIAILVSQEEKKIRIFSRGKMVAQIDLMQKNIEKHVNQIHKILESIGVGALSTIGFSAIAPEMGILIVPGILLFGVPYYLFKEFKSR